MDTGAGITDRPCVGACLPKLADLSASYANTEEEADSGVRVEAAANVEM